MSKSEFHEKCHSAMQAEPGGYQETGTFSVGNLPEGVNVTSAKWVFCRKTSAIRIMTKAKARLIARGF